jgi:SAM-dependent methyltransferase
MAELQLGNVEVFAGDIHELGAAVVGGPFDLAYTRLLLMHQPDPVRTLSRIAELLRPGGWIVAQEALRHPPPQSHPHHDTLGAYWDLLYEVVERFGGVPHGNVDGSPGLRVRRASKWSTSVGASRPRIRRSSSTCTRALSSRRGSGPLPRVS